MAHIKLYDYWRSSAAYRLRIALNLKGVAYDTVEVNLKPGEDGQLSDQYAAINRQKRVPAIDVNGQVFSQSMAILEWLEEAHPTPAILPKNTEDRLRCRAFADTIASDVHPLNNLSVLKTLRTEFGADDVAIKAWYHDWILKGFEALEYFAAQRTHTPFLFGDEPSLAEITLVPQIYNARRYEMDMSPFSALVALDRKCADIEAFQAAVPERVKPKP